MYRVVAILGVLLILAILWDAFETIILPRRVTRRLRLTNLFYRSIWWPWAGLTRRLTSGKRREKYLGLFGPLSLILLLGFWATGVIFGYADITPMEPLGRAFAVVEAGTGFAMLAIVIGYLPVLYQAFSRREVNISLLDARAGSPSSAGELLRRHAECGGMRELTELLRDWERWSAELMESHLSYPVLSYFRSQHDNQSWLSALTTILDTCAFVISEVEDGPVWQARLTFAIARHAVVDLSQIFNIRPAPPDFERLSRQDLLALRRMLASYDVPLRHTDEE